MHTDWSPLDAWPDIPDDDGDGHPLRARPGMEPFGVSAVLRHVWGDDEREREVAEVVAAIRERAIANVAADPRVSPDLIRLWRASVALPAERHHVDCWYRLTRGAALCESGCAGG